MAQVTVLSAGIPPAYSLRVRPLFPRPKTQMMPRRWFSR